MLWKNLSILYLLILVIGLTQSAAQTNPSKESQKRMQIPGVSSTKFHSTNDQCSMALGTNFAPFNYYGSHLPFVDLMKTCRPWVTQNSVNVPGGKNLFDTGVRDSIPADSDGYPLKIPCYVPGTETTQVVLTNFASSIQGHYPAGQYVCLFEGSGSISFSGDAIVTGQTSGRIVLNVTPTQNGIILKITRSDSSDHLRNIRVLMPGTEFTYQTQPFNPMFLGKIQGFKAIRLMNDMNIMNSNDEHWEDRTTPTYYTQGYTWNPNFVKKNGMAIEYAVDLANTLNVDVWLNVPHKADSNYIAHYAQLAKDRLHANLKVYLEYSNEVWNSGYNHGLWVNANAPANLPNLPQKTAYFAARVFRIWKAIWGSESQRIIRVAACQHANAWVGQQIMIYLSQNGGADALSLACYNDLGPFYRDSISALGANTTVTDIFRLMNKYWKEYGASLLRQNQNTADQYKIPMIIYEGGQHLVGNNQPYQPAMIAANYDPRMYDVYHEMFDSARTIGAKLFLNFVLADVYTSSGAWGTIEYIDQDSVGHPKYRFILDYLKNCSGVNPYIPPISPKPDQVILEQNYPNPFNPSTIIRLSLPKPLFITLKVFDLLGREVSTLADEWKESGTYNFTFDTHNFPHGAIASGVYFYRLSVHQTKSEQGFVETKKLLITK
jgi:hypothetical protein